VFCFCFESSVPVLFHQRPLQTTRDDVVNAYGAEADIRSLDRIFDTATDRYWAPILRLQIHKTKFGSKHSFQSWIIIIARGLPLLGERVRDLA
jgi:hypothetical protein